MSTASTAAQTKSKIERAPKIERALKALGWWKSLQLRTNKADGTTTPGDRAALARLRRASTVFEVACEPSVARLHALSNFERPTGRDMITSAVLAGVLAHVREDNKTRLAAAMGSARGESQTISPLRMRRFMAARDPDDVMLQFRRILAILGETANVYDVALLVLHWLDETAAGDRARTRFAFAYHGHAPAAPSEQGERDDADDARPPEADADLPGA